MINFKNKKILITGATGGIGTYLVKKFVSLNGNVIATGTNEKKLENLKNEFPNINTIQFDLSNHSEIESFVDNAFFKLNGIDVLVNNAGITNDNLSLRMKNEEWQKVIDINLSSTFYLCKSVIKKMLKNKSGKIVNITSIVGHTGNIGQSNYSASKAGIIAMSKSLAQEVGSRSVTVNSIAPGFIETNMTAELSDDRKQEILNSISIARLGKPDDIAGAVCFLASDKASYITGQTIHINGGMLMV